MINYEQDKKGKWRWSVKAGNHETLSASSQGFASKQKAEENFEKSTEKMVELATGQKAVLNLVRKIQEGVYFVTDSNAGEKIEALEKSLALKTALVEKRNIQFENCLKHKTQLEEASETSQSRIDKLKNRLQATAEDAEVANKALVMRHNELADAQANTEKWQNISMGLVGVALVAILISIFIL